MPICRLCQNDTKLGKSHIIPAAFFRAALGGDDHLFLVSNDPSSPYRKRLRDGVYDKSILCHECERRFSNVDDYGAAVLLPKEVSHFKPLQRDGKLVAYQVPDVDQARLARFLFSTLWRASVSTHQFFKRIALGNELEAAAARSILNPDQEFSIEFGAVLSCWITDRTDASVIAPLMDPFEETYSGVRVYRFYFGRFVAYLKVDPQPFPLELALFALGAQDPLHVAVRNLNSSKDFATLRKVVGQAHERHERLSQRPKR